MKKTFRKSLKTLVPTAGSGRLKPKNSINSVAEKQINYDEKKLTLEVVNLPDAQGTAQQTVQRTETSAAQKLWDLVLDNRQTKGYEFSKMHKMTAHLTEFVCRELKLMVEVDNYTNFDVERVAKDKIRQYSLEKAGYTVIRFWDEEVKMDIEHIKRKLEIGMELLESAYTMKQITRTA